MCSIVDLLLPVCLSVILSNCFFSRSYIRTVSRSMLGYWRHIIVCLMFVCLFVTLCAVAKRYIQHNKSVRTSE